MRATEELPADPVMVDITKPGSGWYSVVAHYPFGSHCWSVMRCMPDAGWEHIYMSGESAVAIAVCAALNATAGLHGPRVIAVDVREWLDLRKQEKTEEESASSPSTPTPGARP